MEFLSENQPKYADKFITILPDTMENIASNPYHYPVEPLLRNDEENYRYSKFLKFWKILFKVSKEVVLFLNIFHIKQDSKRIEKIKE